jgi:hypothetical protein
MLNPARLRRLAISAPMLGLLAAACGPTGDAAPRLTLSSTSTGAVSSTMSSGSPTAGELSPAARAALDSGNAQFRGGKYDAALASYRAAVKEAPGHTAPEFGIYMAARKIGNAAVADSALRIINAHSGGSKTWTDSAMRSAHGDRKLPPSHPPITP